MKICYVVHRYPPSAGGSEYYVQAMAEESLARGHDVTVFADYNGELNGVKITSNPDIFHVPNRHDLIVVHGGDVWAQNIVLYAGDKIRAATGAKILYMIIKPSESQVCMKGMENADFLGFSTQEDWRHIVKHGYEQKAVFVRHSIPAGISDTIGVGNRFIEKYGIKTPHLIVTAGGFWHHKGMNELADTFKKLDMQDVTLVCLGYMNEQLAPNSEGNVLSYIVKDRKDVMDALAAADLYVMNSTEEGFGLVLLEAMMNKTPWAARHIAGAVELQEYGFTYDNQDQLAEYMKNVRTLKTDNRDRLLVGCNYVLDSRLIKNTVDDIVKVML